MGKANCEENREFSQAINLNNKHAKALRKAENSAGSGEVKRILLAGLLACQEAVVKLVRMQGRHQKRCDECKKGD
jgi:ubiquitin C-terminal hydrolase